MGWIEDLVGQVDIECRVCGTTTVAHVFGFPLLVCPQCFPAESQDTLGDAPEWTL